MSQPEPIRRGDIVLVNLDPVVGHEVGKTRPAVVIQNDVGNKYSPTVIVATITSYSDTKARFPICAVIEPWAGGLTKRRIVNAAQIRTVDRSRLVETLGSLDGKDMAKVDAALRVSLELR